MEAQRYPQDFDGITAGAAAMSFVTQEHLLPRLARTGERGR